MTIDDETLREMHRRRRAGETPDLLALAFGLSSAREVFRLLQKPPPVRPAPEPVLDDRTRAMVAARKAGQTLAAIAAQWGVSRERVRQILHQAGGPSDAQVRAVQDGAARERLDRLGARLHEALHARGTATVEELCAAVGCTPQDLRLAMREADRRFLTVRGGGSVRFTDEAILAGLQELSRLRAAELGVPGPVRVTIAQWNAWRDPARLPSSVRVLQRFRTWATACARAGLPVSERTKPSGAPPRWSDQELVVWVARFVLDPAGGGTAAQYDRWSRRLPGAPGLQTIVTRLGGWNAAKAATGRRTAPTG